MKKLLIFLAAAAMAVSCIINFGGNGVVWVGDCTEEGIDHTEVREVGHFRAVASSLPANVYYVQADKQEVRVESTEELAPKVLTTVEDGKLSLKLESGRYPKLIPPTSKSCRSAAAATCSTRASCTLRAPWP